MSLDTSDSTPTESVFSTSEYDQPLSEIDVVLEPLLETSFSNLSLMVNGEFFSDVDTNECSFAISASVSEYSLAPSEMNVEMPLMVNASGIRVMDSLYCLEKLDDAFLVPVSVGANFLDVANEDSQLAEDTAVESVSEYSVAPSEAEVTMAGL